MAKKILMLAWRDIKNPYSGGAEIVSDVYLSKLAKKGYKITLFASYFKGCKKKEIINGYHVIREGNSLSVYLKGILYVLKHKKEFNFIIDQVNTIPFFTPLYVQKSKRVAFFHQLALNVWFYEKLFPISLIGYLFELLYLRLYKNTRCFVVSKSTKKDLIKYAKTKNILVLENQINSKPKDISKKENQFCYVGRLKKSKRVCDCIKAMKYVNSKLYIIGEGNYKNKLVKLIKKLKLESKVILMGRLSEEEKNNVVKKSLAILLTSVREGWGLVITEANALGTMAITYKVPGVVDANKTGIICEKNNPTELSRNMNMLLKNKNLVKLKSKQSLEFAKKHCNWDKNVRKLEKWLNHSLV